MPRGKQVTVVVGRFDDLVTRGLWALIEEDPSMRLVGAGLRRSELRTLLRSRRPGVAIIDVATLTSPAEVRELCESFPTTRMVLLADRLSSTECAQLLTFGAAACLSRTTQSRDVLNAIHLAAREMQLTPREVSRHDAAAAEVLTPREVEVLAELQQRRANAQIASDLHISVETVRTHARSIYRKLGVRSRRELVSRR
jgi:DNA-binding NarL/FixJ family response regulator